MILIFVFLRKLFYVDAVDEVFIRGFFTLQPFEEQGTPNRPNRALIGRQFGNVVAQRTRVVLRVLG